MKGNLLGALLVSVCLAGQSFGAGMLDRMLGGGCGCDSCEPSCCCEKSCGCPDDCCEDACCGSSCCKERCCILGRLFGGKHKCCEASCGCEDSCCEASCGCASNGGCSSCAPAADAPAGGEASPIPPAPVADPAAKVGMPRKVVSASFVR
jgi:hypothetical protein